MGVKTEDREHTEHREPSPTGRVSENRDVVSFGILFPFRCNGEIECAMPEYHRASRRVTRENLWELNWDSVEEERERMQCGRRHRFGVAQIHVYLSFGHRVCMYAGITGIKL